MTRSLKATLLLSLLVHILFWINLKVAHQLAAKTIALPQEIEILPLKRNETSNGTHPKGAKLKKMTQKSLGQKRFGPHLFELSPRAALQGGDSLRAFGNETSKGPTAGGYGDSESLQGVLLRSHPLENLANLIVNSLSYHQILVENNVEGKVSINIELTPQLELVRWDKPTGTNETLSAYVLVNLIALFGKESLNHEVQKSNKDNLQIRLNFSFKTQGNYPGISTKDFEIVDPSIFVKFVAYREPNFIRWLNENLPVVPIPGGVIINIVAVAKLIEDWDKVDPETRRQQLYQHFTEGLIHKATR